MHCADDLAIRIWDINGHMGKHIDGFLQFMEGMV